MQIYNKTPKSMQFTENTCLSALPIGSDTVTVLRKLNKAVKKLGVISWLIGVSLYLLVIKYMILLKFELPSEDPNSFHCRYTKINKLNWQLIRTHLN